MGPELRLVEVLAEGRLDRNARSFHSYLTYFLVPHFL